MSNYAIIPYIIHIPESIFHFPEHFFGVIFLEGSSWCTCACTVVCWQWFNLHSVLVFWQCKSKNAWIQSCWTEVLLFMQSQNVGTCTVPIICSTCTSFLAAAHVVMYELDPTKHTTMFPSTSCHNPLCRILHKVFRNHAVCSRHLNCSTGCLHYIQIGWSATANQCHPPSSHVPYASIRNASSWKPSK